MILLQNPSVPTATNPVEIDAAILDIKAKLESNLTWLTHGYGRTYKNLDARNGTTVFYPEVYLGTQNNSQRYVNISPDNDKTGQCMFYVFRENIQQFNTNMYSFLSYDTAIIFSVNMELINSSVLDTEIFQQNLVAQVRDVLTRKLLGVNYNLTISSVDFLFENVFSEFDLADATQLEKAPLSHFRFNCTIQVPEACPVPTIAPPVVECRSLVFDGVNEALNCTNNSAFDFNGGNAFSIETWIKFDNLVGFRFIVSKYTRPTPTDIRAYIFSTNGNLLRFSFFSSNTSGIILQTTNTLSTGLWYHLALTYDGSTSANGVSMYINNVENSTIIRNDLTGVSTNTEPLQIGGQDTFFSAAQIAKTRMWNTELSVSDINTQYNGGVIQNTPVQSASLVLDTDIPNGSFGTEWTIPDLTSITGGYTSVNMEESDRVDECPSDIPTVCRSLIFDGVNEYVDCTNNSIFDFGIGNSYSIETWVKFNDLTGFRFLVSKWLTVLPADAQAYFIGNNGDKFTFRMFAGNSTGLIIDSNISLVVGQWYHLMSTYDGSTNASGANLYINNVSDKNVIRDNLSGNIVNTEPLQIGGQSTFFASAQIAKVRVWNLELTPADVTTQYNGGIIQNNPVSSSNLVVDTDINNATFGTEWSIPDLTGFTTGYTSVNMEVEDRVDECPI